MALNILTAVIRKKLESLKDDKRTTNLTDLIAQCDEDLDFLRNTTLDIAITGVSGAGKSSLVNALRGMADDEEGSAKVGDTETTTERKGYPHPTFPKVTVWDLPGIGTPRFNAKKYLKKVAFKQYDFFIIVASNRFTENDRDLANEIRKMKKKFFYVRSKIDQSINAGRRKADFNEEGCLERIRKHCCDNLTKAGESNPKVFLISSWDLSMYDFPLLEETLENDLDDLKRDALILAMPAFSKEVLERKKAAMECYIQVAALVSCGAGAVPVPGLSLACDISILIGAMTYFYDVFGLDEGSLHRLANRVGKPAVVLLSAVKKSPTAHDITFQLVADLLSKAALQQELMLIKPTLKFVPVLGSLVGGALSYATTFYILKNFLDDVVEDAENVRAKAMESHPE
ncbi:PREDICTED: interferon-inducible GTPase 5-like [Gekko japonicus]|uniref:Interferon-inducible GTPase 5-like n=1 Tax=Gekko japonicus TaxID=146911 RepID=A0ABM1KBP0_GEKJA|nr:PREDICTED: interferon-inducible GTPase 5-like [Gekko japonicus]